MAFFLRLQVSYLLYVWSIPHCEAPDQQGWAAAHLKAHTVLGAAGILNPFILITLPKVCIRLGCKV
jgi:hypothetical protein